MVPVFNSELAMRGCDRRTTKPPEAYHCFVFIQWWMQWWSKVQMFNTL